MEQQIPDYVLTYTVGKHERIYPVIGQPIPIQPYIPQPLWYSGPAGVWLRPEPKSIKQLIIDWLNKE